MKIKNIIFLFISAYFFLYKSNILTIEQSNNKILIRYEDLNNFCINKFTQELVDNDKAPITFQKKDAYEAIELARKSDVGSIIQFAGKSYKILSKSLEKALPNEIMTIAEELEPPQTFSINKKTYKVVNSYISIWWSFLNPKFMKCTKLKFENGYIFNDNITRMETIDGNQHTIIYQVKWDNKLIMPIFVLATTYSLWKYLLYIEQQSYAKKYLRQ